MLRSYSIMGVIYIVLNCFLTKIILGIIYWYRYCRIKFKEELLGQGKMLNILIQNYIGNPESVCIYILNNSEWRTFLPYLTTELHFSFLTTRNTHTHKMHKTISVVSNYWLYLFAHLIIG